MYLLRAPDKYPKFGRAFGHNLVDGVALVHKQWDWHTMIRHGFADVTPQNWRRGFEKPEKVEDVIMFHRSGAGDMLFVTPLFRAYAEQHPGVKINVATNPTGIMMVLNNPYVSGFYSDTEEYLPYVAQECDDAICWNGIMTKSHEANLINVYDMFADWAGIELPDERKKPEVYLSDAEKKAAEKWLQDRLDWKEGDQLVTIQLSASSPVRSVEEWKMIEVAKKIRDDGYKVFAFSSTPLNSSIYVACEKCGTCEIIPVPPRFTVNKHKCGKCGNIIDVNNRRGVEGIACSDAGMSLRLIAGIISKASYHIGPDSCGNHLAAAFDVPSLGLFSSFDADLRMRYYTKARWIQKPFPCAPCFSHHMVCRKQGRQRQNAPCMAQFTIDEIYMEFKRMAGGEPWERPEPFKPCESPRPCPVCGIEKRRYINRKGSVCYYECQKCGAVYTDIEAKVAVNTIDYYDDKTTEAYINGQKGSGRILHEKYFRPGKLNRVLDIGCGVAHTLATMHELGWEVAGLEYSTEAIQDTARRYPAIGSRVINADVMSIEEKDSFSLVWMNNVLEHVHQPAPLLRKIWDLLEEGGVLSVQIPNLAVWRQMLYMGKWEGVNNSYAGEHTVLYDRDTLSWMMEENGFEAIDIEQRHGPDCLWMSFKKVVEK